MACCAASAFGSVCQAGNIRFTNGSSETVKVQIVELTGSSAAGFADSVWEYTPGENALLAVNNRPVPAGKKGVFRITSRLGATLLTTSYIDSNGNLSCDFQPSDWNKHRALLQGAKIHVRNLSAEPKKLRLTSITDASGQSRNVDYVFKVAAKQQGMLQSDGKHLLANSVRYTVSDSSGETTGSIGAANLDSDGDLVLALGTDSSTASPPATPPPAPPPAAPASTPAWRRSAVVAQDEEKLKRALGQIAAAGLEYAATTADTKPSFANQVLKQLAQTTRREAVSDAVQNLFPGLSAADCTLVVRVTCDALDNKFNASNADNMRESIARTLKAERPDLRDADAVAELVQIAIAVRDQSKN